MIFSTLDELDKRLNDKNSQELIAKVSNRQYAESIKELLYSKPVPQAIDDEELTVLPGESKL